MKKWATLIAIFAALPVANSQFLPPPSFCISPGFFRNPTDCTRFYRCVDQRRTLGSFQIFHFSCPSGTVFDEITKICNFPFRSAPCDTLASASETVPSPSNPEEPHQPAGPVVVRPPKPPISGGGRPKPGGGRPKPGGGRPHPGGRPKPGGSRPKPGGSRPKPGGGRPKPGGGRPKPGGSRPGIPSGGTRPGSSGTRPESGGSRPGSGVDRPGSGQSRPGSGGTKPGGGRPGGINGIQTPGLGGSKPKPGGSRPGSSGTRPGSGTNRPDSGNKPGFGGGRPGIHPPISGGGIWPNHDGFPGSWPGGGGQPGGGGVGVGGSGGTSPVGNIPGLGGVFPGHGPPISVFPGPGGFIPGPGITIPDSGSFPGSGTGDNGNPGSSTGGVTGTVGGSGGQRPGGGSVRPPPTSPRPPFIDMQEEDEYDYDMYDEEDDLGGEKGQDGKNYEVLSNSIFKCPAPGFYPYEHNCHEFYVCQEVLPGKLLADQLYRCPNRYLFDEDTRRCQREEKVNCRKFTLHRQRPYFKQNVLVVLERYLGEFFRTPLTYEDTKRKFGFVP